MSPDLRSILIAAGVTTLLLLIPVRHNRTVSNFPQQDTLRIVVPGEIHRALVSNFAEDQGCEAIVTQGTASLEDLVAKHIDLAVVPDTTTIPCDAICSKPFLQHTVWVVRAEDRNALSRINHWMTEVSSTRTYRNLEKGKLDRIDSISRYDALIKKHADAIGWDWRLIAAIIYNESRFHNEATSHKGAHGLMQIRSSRYTFDEINDPDKNLAIGTAYLSKMQKMFCPMAANDTECLKFVLAGYNAGDGRIKRCIRQASENGLDTTRWAPVSTMLPQGHHTISYVNKVLDTYKEYSRIYPANRP